MQVIAAVFGPHEVGNRGDMLHDRAVVNAEVGAAAFSSERRRAGRADRRAAETSRALRGALEQVSARC